MWDFVYLLIDLMVKVRFQGNQGLCLDHPRGLSA